MDKPNGTPSSTGLPPWQDESGWAAVLGDLNVAGAIGNPFTGLLGGDAAFQYHFPTTTAAMATVGITALPQITASNALVNSSSAAILAPPAPAPAIAVDPATQALDAEFGEGSKYPILSSSDESEFGSIASYESESEVSSVSSKDEVPYDDAPLEESKQVKDATGVLGASMEELRAEVGTEWSEDADFADRCYVCNDGQSFEEDVLVCCDGCGLWVHQTCYPEMTKVPKGDW